MRKAAFLILVAFAYLYFRGIQDHGLLDPIEGVNASIGLSMVRWRNLFAPLAEVLPGAGKAVGFWWLEALALLIFGWSEFSVRVLSVVASLGTLVATWFLTRRIRDERAANYAAVITGTGFSTYIASQLAAPHALYAAFLSTALTGVVYAFQDRRFFLLFHVSATLAFIAYGPGGIILPWLCLLLYAILAGQERFFLSALFCRSGLAATLFLGGGYLFLLYSVGPSTLTLMRYTPPAPAFNAFSPSLKLFVLGLCPWAGLYVETLSSALPRSSSILPSQREGVLLSIWSAVFLFFGLFSGDGLLVVTVFPALSVLCGAHFSEALEARRILVFQRAVLFEIFFFLPFLLLGILWLSHNGSEALSGTLSSVVVWVFFCLLFLFTGWHYARTRQPKKMMLHLCLASLLSLLPLAGFLDLLAQESSVRDAGLFLRVSMARDDVMVQYAMNRPALFFYTARPSLLFYARPIPGAVGQEIPEDESLSRTWNDSRRVFMLIEKRQQNLTSLPTEVFSLLETSSSANRVVVLSNRRER
ncbi:MAG: glycosyltransferase family 39 protein [Synergistaceae bacterium]|jgi:4-amino-4-deoxy-L-arabinose transferase-like glycosyltransferase|nr:glycosyltransferase family 39 protein [Synergistaceae bacterium]